MAMLATAAPFRWLTNHFRASAPIRAVKDLGHDAPVRFLAVVSKDFPGGTVEDDLALRTIGRLRHNPDASEERPGNFEFDIALVAELLHQSIGG
jgi:hypothetical protein